MLSRKSRVGLLDRLGQASRKRRRKMNDDQLFGEQFESRMLLSAVNGIAADAPEESGPVARIVNGQETTDWQAVGIVNNGCSGTLISPTVVLTAAHCMENFSGGFIGNTAGTFEVNGQVYQSAQIHVHPNYNPGALGTDAANDIAIMVLDRPVTGVTPYEIFRGTPEVGQTLTLVGFGGGGTGNSGHTGDFGTKREGTTPIDGVSSTIISWNFDNNSESNTAPGDSGGPAFVQVNGQYYVAGVTSGGDQANAGIGDHSFDTRVDAYQSWIDSIVGNTPDPDPDPDPDPIDDHVNQPGAGATVITLDADGLGAASGTLEVEGDRDVFEVDLPEDGTLNIDLHETDGFLDTYLHVYDADGNLIAENDDSGGTYNSSLSLDLSAGKYFISAGSYADSEAGDYAVNVDFTEDALPPTDPQPSGQIYYFSTQRPGELVNSDGSSLRVDDSDIVQLTMDDEGNHTFSLYLDGSDVGLTRGGEDIDAFTILDDGSILISTTGNVRVPGVSGTRSDLLQFTPSQTGDDTAGTWSMYLDGSDVGLGGRSENIDGVTVLDDGSLAISTNGTARVPGVTARDEDLLAFEIDQTGNDTSGTWSLLMDGSDIGLRAGSEDVDAVTLDAAGNILLSTRGDLNAGDAFGTGGDIYAFMADSLGSQTSGAMDVALVGSAFGLDYLNVDGLHVVEVPDTAGRSADVSSSDDAHSDGIISLTSSSRGEQQANRTTGDRANRVRRASVRFEASTSPGNSLAGDNCATDNSGTSSGNAAIDDLMSSFDSLSSLL